MRHKVTKFWGKWPRRIPQSGAAKIEALGAMGRATISKTSKADRMVYIAELVDELRRMAIQDGCELLAYTLSVAKLAAEQASEEIGRQNAKSL